jgi:hypothetical protein
MAEEKALNEDPQVAHMRAKVERTRDEVGDTLDAIQERLSPQRLKAQARESLRDATIGRVEKMAHKAGGIMSIARENPLPLALIGLGAGWLFFNARRKEHEPRVQFGTPPGRAPEYEASVERVPQGDGAPTHRVAGALHKVTDVASDVGHRVGHAAGSVAHGVTEGVHDVEERAHDRMVQTRGQYDESPWIGGALALTLGAAAGLALPHTHREDEMFGERRDELLSRAKDVGREKLDASRRVAREVIEDTRESVRQHARDEGLSGL